jgi:preprotein translocase subunit SecB
MKYTLSTAYRWVDTTEENFIVKMYFIQDMPYTFDELPDVMQNDPNIVLEASSSHRYSDEELYRASVYLTVEECHPLMYELDLVNPELLPVD